MSRAVHEAKRARSNEGLKSVAIVYHFSDKGIGGFCDLQWRTVRIAETNFVRVVLSAFWADLQVCSSKPSTVRF